MRKTKNGLPIILTMLIITILSTPIFGAGETIKEFTYEDIDEIFIDIGGVEIFFDSTIEHIEVSERVKVRPSGNSLYLTGPRKMFFSNDKHYIIIGTAVDYKCVDIDAGGGVIRGTLKANEINISCGGMDIGADLYGEKISIAGGGFTLRGEIESEHLTLKGGGMDIDISVEKVRKINIDGAGISADIKYMDAWEGRRIIDITGVGGDVKLLVPEENELSEDGYLDINTDGIIDLDINYYNLD